MATLHLIAKAPVGTDIIGRCFASAVAGDAILFLGQGVMAAKYVNPVDGVSLYAQADDVGRLALRNQVPPFVQLIEDGRFVELVVQYRVSVSWT